MLLHVLWLWRRRRRHVRHMELGRARHVLVGLLLGQGLLLPGLLPGACMLCMLHLLLLMCCLRLAQQEQRL